MLATVTLPPEPNSRPLVQTLRWAFRPLPFMQACREKLGDNFSLKFLGFERPMVMISDPVAIKTLYTEPGHGLPPGRNVFLEPVLGSRSLLLLEGADHLAHRKLMLPAFHGERMRSYQPLVEEIVDAEIDSWRLDEELPIHPRMQAITLEVILRVVFGVAEGERLRRLRVLLTDVLAETGSPFVQLTALATRRFTGRGPWDKFEGRLREVDDLLYAEIAERRSSADAGERDDILAVLMAARFEDGEGLTDVDLRDQLLTLLLAGHETTATGLAWTFDLLLHSPEALERLLAELEGGGGDYLDAVITESLRLRPVVPMTGRLLREPATLGGFELDAGTVVLAAIYMAHTNSDTYPEPFLFRPERFLSKGPDTYSWVPFGGGTRRCIGAAFAQMEMRVALRTVLSSVALRPAKPEPEPMVRRNVTLSPRDGAPAVLERRL
jgi:cytochrome P450